MSELPSSWAKVNLGEVAEFEMGQAPPGTTCNAEGRGTVFVKAGEFGPDFPVVREWTTQPLKFARKGDVLICVVGATSGKLNLGIDCAIGRSVAAIRPTPVIGQSVLYRQLQLQVEQLRADSTGTAQGVISKQMLADIQVVVPPFAEQTRISNQLDALLARIKACNDHLDAIPGLLKRFRHAVLDAATFGVLTQQWRSEQHSVESARQLRHAIEADHTAAGGHERGNASEPTQEAHDLAADQFPDGWEISTLRDCCLPGRPITYGILKPGPELDEGVPYIRVADFPGNKLNLKSIKRTSPEIDLQFKRARLIGGDLLLSIRGSVGRLIVIPPSLEGANITQDTARLSINPRLNTRYVYYALLSSDSQRRMAKAVRGVAVRGINIGDVRALQIPLPSLPEQAEIVRQVDELFSLADQIEARWINMRAIAQRLTPQVLAKAFRGELVAQDTNDEPASQLIRRIAAAQSESAKTASGGTARGRKKSEVPGVHPVTRPAMPTWADLPDDAWSDYGASHDEHLVTVMLTAVLKAWSRPMPQEQARLAALLCLQPRLFTAALPAEQAAQWRRLVGRTAETLPTQVASLQPALNAPWRRALAGMRGRGDLLECGQGAMATWSLGPEAIRVDTSGWPDGRAGRVLAYLETHGVNAVLPTLASDMHEFVHARAA